MLTTVSHIFLSVLAEARVFMQTAERAVVCHRSQYRLWQEVQSGTAGGCAAKAGGCAGT